MLTLSPALTLNSYEVHADDDNDTSQSDTDNSEGNEDENESDDNNEGNGADDEPGDGNEVDGDDSESGDDSEGNEEESESGDGNEENNGNDDANNNKNDEEESEPNSDDPQVVTPELPTITEATCDANGNVIAPKLDFESNPDVDGVLYELTGDIKVEDLKPGDTVTIIASAYDRYDDEGLVLEVPDGWTDLGDGMATVQITFDNIDCDKADEEDEDEEAGQVYEVAGKIVAIDRDGCIVSIKTQLEPEDYEIQVWDDQVNIDTITKSVSEAGEYTFNWEIKNPAMEGAPGVAFVLYAEDETGHRAKLDSIDPYEYPREVANKCAGVTEDETSPEGLGGPADPNDPEIFGQGGPEVLAEEVTVKSEPEVIEVAHGEQLPNTATPYYNLVLYGLGILLLGAASLFVFRKSKA